MQGKVPVLHEKPFDPNLNTQAIVFRLVLAPSYGLVDVPNQKEDPRKSRFAPLILTMPGGR